MATAIDPLTSPSADASPLPPGAVTAPPELTGMPKALSDASRTMFRYANRYVMIPLHRAGLAAWLGNPVTGWQCLVTTIGRRSGLRRHTPLGYLVMDGAAWVMAGYGPATLWYRNVLDDPRVELLLPGRPPIAALAAEERDPSVRAHVIPPLARSMAIPGAMMGCFPPTSADERILACVSWVPLVRIAPADGTPLAPGPDDPGGLGWTWRQALALGVSFVGARALWRALRG
jgi:deazaflavin-dependent oxidoreductase (nitroreductase family)